MFIKTLYNVYKNSFDINSNYLMDSAESNRISVLVVSSLLLLSDIIDLLLLFIVHHAHLHEQLHYLIYLSSMQGIQKTVNTLRRQFQSIYFYL